MKIIPIVLGPQDQNFSQDDKIKEKITVTEKPKPEIY